MTTIDPTKPLTDTKSDNSEKTAKKTGFQLNPQDINRNGRPKNNWTWKELFAEVAEELIEVKNKEGKVTDRRLFKKHLAKKLFQKAATGDVPAFNAIMNRMDGMPKQQTELSGDMHITIDRANNE